MSNEATLSGFEPISALLAGPSGGTAGEISVSQGKANGSGNTTNTTAVSTTEKPIAGLVLGGGLPAIPSDILKRIQSKSYVELSELLPERIRESFLYPDGKKKKAPAIDKFVDWVLAFCTYSQALLSVNSSIGGELLIFVGTAARLARDRYLLGMQWKNKVFIDNQLPFGLRSAPLLFNAYADALEWIFRKQGMPNILHYLDDFLVVGSPATSECQHSLNSIMAICTQLSVPLGIQIDTEKMQARLPADKLSRLQRELTSW